MSNSSPSAMSAWANLARHKAFMTDKVLSALFARDMLRASRFTLEVDGLFLDYSKNLITDDTIACLCDFAVERNAEAQRADLFASVHVNTTEDRPALHMALREGMPTEAALASEIRNTWERMRVLSAQWRDAKRITDLVHIGVGGSVLGPRLVCEALCPLGSNPVKVHFVTSVDMQDLEEVFTNLDPARTAFVVVSKSFATMETLLIARAARAWSKGAGPMVAVTANKAAALAFGVAEEDIFSIPLTVGGRYSLWSAASLALCVQNSFSDFKSLLHGAKAMDAHFLEAPIAYNMPFILGLLSVWYRNFWDKQAHAILPYSHRLRGLPTYIQQIEMESNGKSVDKYGSPLSVSTAPVIFGDVGPNAQHAMGQSLHQGVDFIPCDFVIVAGAGKVLAAHAIAQSQALMEGVQSTESHKKCAGNRPSTTFVLPRLDAQYLGMLLALYEHKVFVESALWGINGFDQWGVELGKTLANDVLHVLEGGAVTGALDSSTRGLIDHVQKFCV